MKHFFKQDKVIVGIVVGVGSMILFCLLLIGGLIFAGYPLDHNPRWYGGMFIPLTLLLMHYARRREQLTVTRTLIVILFITFILFMVYILNNHLITFR